MEIRLARLEGAYEQIDKRLESLERQFNTRFDAQNARFDGLQWRMTALIVGTWTTMMLAVLGLYIKH